MSRRERPVHTYVNIEGTPLSTNGVRVKGDFVEFFDVDKEAREINSSSPIWLPGILKSLTSDLPAA